MAHEMHRLGLEFSLYYKSKTKAQAAFIPEIEKSPWRHRVHFHFSDERRLDVSDVLNDYQPGDHLYTCGPAGFMDFVFEIALANGWNEESLHKEYFSAPDTSHLVNHPFVLELALTGRTINVASDQSATAALKKEGINIDVKCSDGLCGVCVTKLLAGEVEHRDHVLSKVQKLNNVILCCSRAALPNGTITLDL